MIKDKFGHKLDEWIQAIFPFLFKRSINPDLLTWLGAFVSVGAATAYADGNFVVGSLLLALGGGFDLVDGVVARHFGQSTAFGAFLDSTLDRFVDMVVLLALAIHYAGSGAVAIAWIVGVVLMSSILTSYTRARAEALDIDLSVGIIERGERIGLLIIGGLAGYMEVALSILAVGATVTVTQRFIAARNGIERLARAEADAQGGGERLAHGE